MRRDIGNLRSLYALTCTLCAVSGLGTAASATVLEWVPVDASGTHTINGNLIVLTGAGQTVTLHLMVSDWDPDSTGATLGSWQGSVDPAGYLGANASPPNPGVDLEPVGFPLSPGDGAFQAIKVCSDDVFDPPFFETFDLLSSCQSNGDCNTGFVCIERPDYVFFGLDNVPTVTHNTLSYSWSSAVPPPNCPGTDGTTKYYGGTLVLTVPGSAIGTYTVNFVDDTNFTLANNCSGELLGVPIKIPAQIAIACSSNLDCDDSNECTTDVCEAGGVCSNTPAYNPATHCCDPAVGPPSGLTVIDDLNECTDDICDPADGTVTHPPLTGSPCGGAPSGECDLQDTCNSLGQCAVNLAPEGTTCGNQGSSECDFADTCDGAGACQDNLQSVGAACGDPTTTDCNRADSCDGNGTCVDGIVASGSACGDPTDTECNHPDTCDGAGSCQSNLEPGGLACGSQVGNQCDSADTCDGAGICAPNYELIGTACGNPAGSECDNPDACDGVGVCAPNHKPDGTGCTDDGNSCRDDVCATGVCTHPLSPPGAVCGDPPVGECDAADECDGAGTCLPEFIPSGTACGDPADTECNGADSCDGAGNCAGNVDPAGTACGDPTDTDCNAPDTCDGAGLCGANLVPVGLTCGSQVGNQCDNPDTCDGAGACESNFVLTGTACGNPADTECDNPDACDGVGGCTPNNEPDGTGCTDDGNSCRDDVCETGVCSHPLSPPGTVCGDPPVGECDASELCDGAGTCLPAFVPSGTPCGDPADTECNGADSCDGAGSCSSNVEPAGTGCGDPTDTDCDGPDTCDGVGLCATNVEPVGLPCGSQVGNQCDNTDTCDGAGACEPNFVLVGTACGNPADTECDDPDTCDGAGSCDPNDLPDGSLCTDDGNDCRADVCLAGSCSHPFKPDGDPCGNPADSDCDGADTCDGGGSCVLNLAPSGASCDDLGDTFCTDPDTCDGLGTCLPNNQPDATPCDDGVFCSVETICLGGACSGGSAIDCDDGLPCTLDSCNEPLQQCDNDLQPGGCLIGGACYLDGGLNPENDCEICDIATSTTTWSLLPVGSACDDGDSCTGTGEPGIGFDECTAAGVCEGTIDPGCNDDCINAVEVFDGNNIGNNENRGVDDDEATCQPLSDNDVWFFYNALCDGLVDIDTIGSQFAPSNDTVLSVYDACGGVEVGCDDDSGPGLLSWVEFGATAASTYWIRVAGFMDNAGDLVLHIATVDNCVIDGACVPGGTLNPANECEACIPWLSSTSWSSRSVGSSCGDPGKGDCDNPDSCDGNGVCEPDNKPDQTVCSDDGNDCTNDVCLAGGCTHPPKQAGAACGDATVTECDSADTCDGAAACLDNFAPTGLGCGDQSTSDCDNADICDGAGSCDPNHQVDGLVCTDDGVECTFDECGLGLCLHPPRPSGTACGDAGDTECDNPDTCDGAGGCTTNYEPALTTCGDLSDTDCDNPDSCDGSGSCVLNFEPVATLCGDPTDTGCDNHDTCDGSGTCLDNLELPGFPCGDPANTQCDNPDTCDGVGICLDNHQSFGSPCGDPSSSDCDNADICDGVGSCDPNHQADGLVCTDDGVECTFDECDLGLCLHPPRPTGTACGDAGDTECDNPDTCDGAGGCGTNFEPALTTCGDPSDTDCDNPDSCDGSGSCVLNFEPVAALCGDPTDTGCDNHDTCDGSGTCLDNLELPGFPCGDPANTQCDNPDTCDGVGVCLDNNQSFGSPCGDPSSSDCDNADICDGVGSCDPNHQADGLVCTDDGEQCTFDECSLGNCIHPPRPAGIGCGDPGDTGCDNPDSCDGAGACGNNNEPTGTACGSPVDTECDNPDTCDGGGTCLVNFEPGGFSCGSAVDTDCDNPDSCDGAGVCLDNFEVIGFACGDPNRTQCDNPDTCDSTGTCLANYEPTGVPCGDPADTDCDDPDTCDGGGECAINHEPDGTTCPDDANDCSDDVCQTGLCDHPPKPAGTPCGDPSDSQCDHPDTCDATSTCLGNLEPNGTRCDDEQVCTDVDVCLDGTCAGTLIVEAPIVESFGPKAITITPDPLGSGPDIAFIITSPDWPCLNKYVGWLRCGGVGRACTTDAECNECSISLAPCLSSADCDWGICDSGNDCSVAAQDCADASTCVLNEFCQLSGDPCFPAPLEAIDINNDGLVDGMLGTPVDDPAHAAVMAPDEWTAGVTRCSESALPCTVDTDCSRGICTNGAICNVFVQNCGDASTCVLDETCEPGRLFLRGKDIVPGSQYNIEAQCGAFRPVVASATTCLWGDVNCDDIVNVTDIQLEKLGFQGIFQFATLIELDIHPCNPQAIINVSDIQRVVLAMQGQTYDQTECPLPCP